ncbi:MAG: cation:proton antiporter [Gammaproteobacteria bacterium]|nr:cation:proton antiporter [Gammaproteobacteria bacterium]
MDSVNIVFAFFVIFFGASVLATLALFTRQSMLVGYILLGIIAGPWCLRLIHNVNTVSEISSVGIMFLLFLLGLNLQPKNLLNMLHGATITTAISSLIFAVIGALTARAFGFNVLDSSVIGIAMMFSSTIIGLKLLPTTALHHQRLGEILVSILLLQDVLAILVLLAFNVWGKDAHQFQIWAVVKILCAVPLLIAIGYFAEKHLIHHLFRRFNRINEYIFLLALGWCLGLSELAAVLGLSHEIGAFIAGVSLAASPISQYIAESLKPLRDFFLIVFFFSIGAGFDFHLLPLVFFPVLGIALLMLMLKPIVFRLLLSSMQEHHPSKAWELGVRLGQASEFSMLLAFLAYQSALISQNAYITIQAVTLITFIVSSYAVVLKYPSPMALDARLRRD